MQNIKFKDLFKNYATQERPTPKTGFAMSNKKTADLSLSHNMGQVIATVKDEIIALVFLASVDGHYMDKQKVMIAEYILRRASGLDISKVEIMEYIDTVTPNLEDFYEAIDDLSEKSNVVLQLFIERFMQLIFADDIVDKNEKAILDEMIKTFKEDGFNIQIATEN